MKIIYKIIFLIIVAVFLYECAPKVQEVKKNEPEQNVKKPTEEALEPVPDFIKALDLHAIYKDYIDSGLIMVEEKKFQEAIDFFEKAKKVDPKGIEARVNLAETLPRLGKVDEAIQEYQELLNIHPDVHRARYGLAVLYLNDFQYAQALEEAQKAVELDPENVMYRYFLAQMYGRTNQFQKAIEELFVCLQLNPGQAKYYVPLSDMYERVGKPEDALQALRNAVEQDPASPFGDLASGLLSIKEKEIKQKEELKELETTLEKNPEDWETQHKIAKIYFDLERFYEARKIFEKYLANKNGSTEDYSRLGEICGKLKDPAAAAENFKKAYQLDPKNLENLFQYAKYSFDLGQVDDAREAMRKILAQDPESDLGKSAKAFLDMYANE